MTQMSGGKIMKDEFSGNQDVRQISVDVLHRIGKVAKGKYNKKKNQIEGAWFKRIDRGQDVGDIVFSSDNQIEDGSRFKEVIKGILNWVTCHES